MKNNGPSEKIVKRKAGVYLRSVDQCVFFHYSAYLGTAGVPDIIGYVKKREWCVPFAIEFKRRGCTLTPIQTVFIERLRKVGVKVLAPCYTVEEVKEFINKITNKEEQDAKEK